MKKALGLAGKYVIMFLSCLFPRSRKIYIFGAWLGEQFADNPKYLFCDEPNSGLDPKTAIVIDNLIQEITEEYNITTVINTHDMNSVMEIGQKIVFLKNGLLEWEGSNKEIFKTDNEAVTDFVYSSELFKRVRKMYLDDAIE